MKKNYKCFESKFQSTTLREIKGAKSSLRVNKYDFSMHLELFASFLFKNKIQIFLMIEFQ